MEFNIDFLTSTTIPIDDNIGIVLKIKFNADQMTLVENGLLHFRSGHGAVASLPVWEEELKELGLKYKVKIVGNFWNPRLYMWRRSYRACKNALKFVGIENYIEQFKEEEEND